MSRKARVKRAKGGCSTKGGKLYIVKVPGRLFATKKKNVATKAYRNCRKKNKRLGTCTMTTVRGARRPRRRRR